MLALQLQQKLEDEETLEFGLSGSSQPSMLTFHTTEDGASSVTERLRITSSGNVGIGTDNPRSGLEVQGTDGARITRALTGGNFSI